MKSTDTLARQNAQTREVKGESHSWVLSPKQEIKKKTISGYRVRGKGGKKGRGEIKKEKSRRAKMETRKKRFSSPAKCKRKKHDLQWT